MRLHRGLRFVLLCLAALAGGLAATVLAAAAALAPGSAAWTVPLTVTVLGHTWQHHVSGPVLLRLVSHPLAAPLIDGRHIDTTHGRWQLTAQPSAGWVATCAPCQIAVPALGPAPLALERVELHVRADGADHYRGSVKLGAAPHTLLLSWHGHVDRSGSLQLDARLPPSPLQGAVQVFGSALPERGSVRVDGSLALTLSGRLPAGPWRVQPRLDGFMVHGLGTERLLDLQLPPACREGRKLDVPAATGWLPRAVIAAEDQRFFEHPGYDLAALTDTLQHNQQAGAVLGGASTLTQQLAKRLFTGDDRSAARKLRELLYAVEMERTLGKPRILQLYLALAPWGQGVCGAERAARVHLGLRDAAAAGPVAAAWLASLLPQPDALLSTEQQRGQVDVERVARVIRALRPMSVERREAALAALASWAPPALGSHAATAAPPRPIATP